MARALYQAVVGWRRGESDSPSHGVGPHQVGTEWHIAPTVEGRAEGKADPLLRLLRAGRFHQGLTKIRPRGFVHDRGSQGNRSANRELGPKSLAHEAATNVQKWLERRRAERAPQQDRIAEIIPLDTHITQEWHAASLSSGPSVEKCVASLARRYREQILVLAVNLFKRGSADAILETEDIEKGHDKLVANCRHNQVSAYYSFGRPTVATAQS